jgi:hypothetical protein
MAEQWELLANTEERPYLSSPFQNRDKGEHSFDLKRA